MAYDLEFKAISGVVVRISLLLTWLSITNSVGINL